MLATNSVLHQFLTHAHTVDLYLKTELEFKSSSDDAGSPNLYNVVFIQLQGFNAVSNPVQNFKLFKMLYCLD